MALRCPDGFVCASCAGTRHSVIKSRGLYQCFACSQQTSPTAGTIFAATNLPVRLWFKCIYHLTQARLEHMSHGFGAIEITNLDGAPIDPRQRPDVMRALGSDVSQKPR